MAALFLHNPSMVNLSAGDLGLEIDYGSSKPGDVLQRWDYPQDGWRDFERDGKLVTNLFDYTTLSPGRYRLRQN